MKRLAVGILAHVDAGKTTLSEAMLYHSGAIRSLGRVDHGDAFLDTDSIEKERGITIFSKQAVMEWEDTSITLLDTPGHVDFSAEMERTLSVLDYAILVISASDGVQSHTETVWKLLQRYQVPVFLFVNKMDLAVRKDVEILASIAKRLDGNLVDFRDTEKESFYDDVSLCSESLTEELLLEGSLSTEAIVTSIANREVVPVYFGSALKDQGVLELMEGLQKYSRMPSYGTEFGAKVFKVNRDDRGQRLVFAKVTGGSIGVKEAVGDEKVNQIRIYSGQKYTLKESAEAGVVCAFTGLENVSIGDGLGVETDGASEVLEPFMTYRVELPPEVDVFRGLADFRQLAEEDPKLHVTWQEEKQEILLSMMGQVQLEVMAQLVETRFGYAVTFDQGQIVYKETLAPDSEPVEGVGHFEPLRHYAEVHLVLEPGERGSGMVFATDVSEDVLDRNWQRLIMTHLLEKEHRGVLLGAPLTDMKVTLVAGRAHKKHTEGGDFRQATYRALRCGLMRGKSILLEPWFQFTITVPTEHVGRVMSDVQRMKGEFDPPETLDEMTRISGQAPVSEMKEYPSELAAFTGGRGSIRCFMAGYAPCHEEAAVLETAEYDPERDTENPADSVFCSHGSGTIVSWKEIEEHAHVAMVLSPEKEEEDYSSKARRYAARMATDGELMAIFERTYGPVKRHDLTAPGRNHRPKPKEAQDFGWKAKKTVQKTKPQDDTVYILIDGYNLIHAWPELTELSQADFGAARERLVDILCNYQGFTQHQVIVVFDAYKVKGGVGSQQRIRNVDVVYTKEAETADMYIEKVTHTMAKHHNVRVVTSDGLEQLIILGHGALRISSREFIEEIHRMEEAIYEVIGK